MVIESARKFIQEIRAFGIDTEYAIIKPNWVSNDYGEYTEPEILDWLLEAIPDQKKIIIESYTPWRGLRFFQDNKKNPEVVSLVSGIKYWDLYKQQDREFLELTGIRKVMERHKIEYVNITNEVWVKRCVKPETVLGVIGKVDLRWPELCSYVPKRLFELREKATLISLSKIKIEDSIPVIGVSMSVKNLFGLIPHPSRWEPFHGQGHSLIPEAIREMYLIYSGIFTNSVWITEGIKTLVMNYCDPEQKIIEDKGWYFIGRDGRKVDEEACEEMGLDAAKIPQLTMI
jgi:uncharacterized protein (DUF362 family)